MEEETLGDEVLDDTRNKATWSANIDLANCPGENLYHMPRGFHLWEAFWVYPEEGWKCMHVDKRSL